MSDKLTFLTLIAVALALGGVSAVTADDQVLGDPPPAIATPDQAAPDQLFESGGISWRLLSDYVAMEEAEATTVPGSVPGSGDGPLVAGRRVMHLPAASGTDASALPPPGFAPAQALPVAWDAYHRRYGLLTGEVLAYTAAGEIGPRDGLPAGLAYAQAFPDLGVTSYRLSTTDLGVVDALAAMPGVEEIEIVVKTQRLRPH
jgi:hypothetical protein